MNKLFLSLLIASASLWAAAPKELSASKTKTSPLLNVVTGGQKPVQNIILEYLAGDFVLSKTIDAGAPVVSLAYSPDGKEIISSGSPDGEIFIWDTQTGKLKETLEGHTDIVNAVAYSPDGKLIGSGSDDTTVKIWDALTRNLIHTLQSKYEDIVKKILAIKFSPSGKEISSGSEYGAIKRWSTKSDEDSGYIFCPSNPSDSFVYDLSGNYIFVPTTPPDHLSIWRLGERESEHMINVPIEKALIVTHHPNLKQIAVGLVTGEVALLDYHDLDELNKMGWREAEKKSIIHLKSILAHNAPIIALIYSPDGKYIATAAKDKKVKIWDVKTTDLVAELPQEDTPILSLAFGPDSEALAIGTDDGKIKIYKRQDVALTEFKEAAGADHE